MSEKEIEGFLKLYPEIGKFDVDPSYGEQVPVPEEHVEETLEDQPKEEEIINELIPDQQRQELLDWFSLSHEQLYGALAYYYGHRDEILAREKETAEKAEVMAKKGTKKLEQWRNNRNK